MFAAAAAAAAVVEDEDSFSKDALDHLYREKKIKEYR